MQRSKFFDPQGSGMKRLKVLRFFAGFFRRSLAAKLSIIAFLSIALVCAAFSVIAYRDVTKTLM
jgi:uncharacterized protein involved in exopolysaccharide biosynthesis